MSRETTERFATRYVSARHLLALRLACPESLRPTLDFSPSGAYLKHVVHISDPLRLDRTIRVDSLNSSFKAFRCEATFRERIWRAATHRRD